MAEIKKPSEVKYTGEITSISRAIESKTKKDSYYRIITLDSWNGKALVTRPIAEKMFENSKDLLQKGNFVELTCQQTIEGVTEYVDAQGDVQKHTSTGENISRVVGASKDKIIMAYQASLKA